MAEHLSLTPVVKEIIASPAGREFSLDLSRHFRYIAEPAHRFEAKRRNERTGKAVNTMCFSPCIVHATREAFVQRQLLQCQTCGSQAFHVLDCCRHPNYVRVSTSQLGKRLKAWLGGMQGMARAWLFQPRQRHAQPVSSEAFDAWEARPIVISTSGDVQAPRQTGADKAMEEVECETVSARH
ncbi:MAG: hypothetical protein ACRERE_35980 [Candidatus Entotheonellia bacterium]